MADVIILGRGPAGISASLYTARAGLDTAVLGKAGGTLEKAGKIENYFGFAEPVSGHELLENGAAQARRIGAALVDGEAVDISYDGKFTVSTEEKEYHAPFVILATGSERKAPKTAGITKFEGHGVSWCAVCDGFFYRGKDVAVLGAGSYALHEAQTLLPIVRSVTVLTDGAKPEAEFPKEIPVATGKIDSLYGGTVLEGIRFADGSQKKISGLFIALGIAGSVEFARKLGAETTGAAIKVDENRRTSVPGLYAAGDCTGGLPQISKAVCDGAIAGTSVVREFRRASL